MTFSFELEYKSMCAPVGYQEINFHMVFCLNINLAIKASFVTGCHQTDPLINATYKYLVSSYSVFVSLILSDLNNIDILGGYIQGAYINYPCK